MSNKKGFTLIELTVVIVIIGIMAVITVPAYFTMIQQSAAKAAQNNLIVIAVAEKSYMLNNTSPCIASSPASSSCTSVGANCAATLAEINCNLSLNINDDNYTYTILGVPGIMEASASSNNTHFILTQPGQILLPGSNCGALPFYPLNCNPTCSGQFCP